MLVNKYELVSRIGKCISENKESKLDLNTLIAKVILTGGSLCALNLILNHKIKIDIQKLNNEDARDARERACDSAEKGHDRVSEKILDDHKTVEVAKANNGTVSGEGNNKKSVSFNTSFKSENEIKDIFKEGSKVNKSDK